MKVSELIAVLENYPQEKECVVEAPNGLICSVNPKIILKDKYDGLNHSDENIDKIILSY